VIIKDLLPFWEKSAIKPSCQMEQVRGLPSSLVHRARGYKTQIDPFAWCKPYSKILCSSILKPSCAPPTVKCLQISWCGGLTQQLATRIRQPLAHPSLSSPVGWGGEMHRRGKLGVEIKAV